MITSQQQEIWDNIQAFPIYKFAVLFCINLQIQVFQFIALFMRRLDTLMPLFEVAVT